MEEADDDLSGFLLQDGGNAIIGVNANHHDNRQRFTIAHEIGHFVLHAREKLHVDRRDRALQLKHRDELSSAGIIVEEKEANLFAAELLMPARFLEKDVAELEPTDLLDEGSSSALSQLAERYGVSQQALTFRLANLGYIEI